MTDLATLGIRIQSQEAEVAEDRLDGMAMAADRAENATDSLAVAARRADGAVGTMNVAVRQQTAVLSASRAGMGLTAAEGLNMSRQITDVGVQMAMGMNPFLIAIQQGPQIMDIFQMAAIRTGTTVSGAMAGMGRAIWVAMAPLLPVIAAIGAAAGVLAGSWALATRSMRSEIGDLTSDMNLTEAQIKRLEEQSVSTSITAGDAFRGLGTTIKEMFVETFGTQLDWVADRWSEFLSFATEWTSKAVKAIGGAFVGGFYAVRDTWSLLPAAIGDAAIGAAQLAVNAVEWIVNQGVAGINKLIRGAQSLGPFIPFGGQISQIEQLSEWNAPTIGNPNRGGMNAAGASISSAISRGRADFDASFASFFDRLAQNTRASGQARIRDAAGEAGTARAAGGRAGGRSAETGYIPLTRDRGEMDEPLRDQIGSYVSQLELVANELRLIDGLARDVSRGLSSAFGDSGRALGDLLTATTSYQAKMAEIALAEQENRLTGAQADRERAQSQIGAYGDMASAAKGFFKEGSDGYRALQAAEQAFRLLQLAGMMQSMLFDTQMTGTSIANSLARGAANAAEGASKIFAMLGPYAFPVVAGMTALLLSMGIRSGGGRGSAPSVSGDSSAQRVRASGAAQTAAVSASEIKVSVESNDDKLRVFVQREAAPVAEAAAGRMGRRVLDTSRRAAPALQQRQSLLGTP